MRTTPEMCFWDATGHEWKEISDFYLQFRLKSAPFGKMCVVTPDNLHRPHPRFFIPTQERILHDPDRFVESISKMPKKTSRLHQWH